MPQNSTVHKHFLKAHMIETFSGGDVKLKLRRNFVCVSSVNENRFKYKKLHIQNYYHVHL